MKQFALKLLFVSILLGLITMGVSAADPMMYGSSGAAYAPPVNDNNAAALAFESSAGPINAMGPDATYNTIPAMVYYIRKNDQTVVKGVIPAAGMTINVKGSEILRLGFQGRYSGPAGTYAMLDYYNSGGTWPMKGVPRVDTAVTMGPGVTTTMYSLPFWANHGAGTIGSYPTLLEMWGGGQVKLVPITINVIAD